MSQELMQELRDTAAAGEHAKALKDNPLFAGLLVAEKARLFQEFSRSKWWQRRLRQAVWEQIQAVNALENKLHGLLFQGEMAKDELKKRTRLDKRKSY